jgi:hypothetical protein
VRIRVVYKIVRVEGDGYGSISWREGDYPYVRYRPGQWTYAPEMMARLGYHLCAFVTLTALHKYICPYGPPRDWEVWRCDARGVSEPRGFPQRCAAAPLKRGWGSRTSWASQRQSVFRSDVLRPH